MKTTKPQDLMEYVTLGRSGLKISRFGFGNWVNSSSKEEAQKIANELVKLSWDTGINFFDTAEGYGAGEAERQFGTALRALKVPRSDYILTTKIFFGRLTGSTTKHNVMGVSRKRLIEGLDRSLSNLGFDYVDVVFCHRYDNETPTLEICYAMKSIIDLGKAFYWATSEWPVERVMEAIHICDKINCPRPIAEQCQYSMIERDSIEKRYITLFDDYNYGTTIWSPLLSGILTGKYNSGIPDDSRFATAPRYIKIYNKYLAEGKREKTLKVLNGIKGVADKLGCTMAQLALAWTLVSKDVSTCLLGASKVSQLEANLKSLEIKQKLTKEVLEELEGILRNRPEQDFDWKVFSNRPHRR